MVISKPPRCSQSNWRNNELNITGYTKTSNLGTYKIGNFPYQKCKGEFKIPKTGRYLIISDLTLHFSNTMCDTIENKKSFPRFPVRFMQNVVRVRGDHKTELEPDSVPEVMTSCVSRKTSVVLVTYLKESDIVKVKVFTEIPNVVVGRDLTGRISIHFLNS